MQYFEEPKVIKIISLMFCLSFSGFSNKYLPIGHLGIFTFKMHNQTGRNNQIFLKCSVVNKIFSISQTHPFLWQITWQAGCQHGKFLKNYQIKSKNGTVLRPTAVNSMIIYPQILSGRAAWLSHRKHMSLILSTKACPYRHL